MSINPRFQPRTADTQAEVHGNRTKAQDTGETGLSQESGAESGARNAPDDPRLAAVVAAWPALGEAAKAAILAIVEGPDGGA